MAARIGTFVRRPDGSYDLVGTRQSARSFGMQFAVVFTEPYSRMVRRIRTHPAYRIFTVLPQYLDFTEFKTLRQADLMQDLGLSSASVSRALNELAELGAIERKGKGPVVTWRLSMEWGWQGSTASFHKERRKRAEAAAQKPKFRVISNDPPPAARATRDTCPH